MLIPVIPLPEKSEQGCILWCDALILFSDCLLDEHSFVNVISC